MSDSEEPIDNISEGGDDLFGDDPDDGISSPKARVLDDDDLATDPDEDDDARRKRQYSDAPQEEERETLVLDVPTYRHSIPKPTDGILRALRVPKFIKFNPEEYQPDAFEATDYDFSNARSEHPQHVTRFIRNESTGLLKSNTNILRWSDGSVTISVGGEQYEISKKRLAPAPGQPYKEVNDVHYYAAAAELSSNVLMNVGHITEQYSVRPNKEVGDDALNLLAERMAEASKAGRHDRIIQTTQDPELQKKQAEQLEKERMKAERRRENAQLKQEGDLGRSRGGLSIGGLEGRGNGRKRSAAGGGKPKRRRPEYDSDDDLPTGAHRDEKYDMDDGFLVDSDEDEDPETGDDDDEELLEERPRAKKRQKTEELEDASGEEEEPAQDLSRARRRRVVDDDEDSE